MTCCVFCVNMIKIKKAAQALRKALPLNALILPFPVKKVMKCLKVWKDGKWYSIKLIETNKIPYQAEAVTFNDGNIIKVLIVKDYEKHFSSKRKRWTLMHELSHICLGHSFVPGSSLTDVMRWYLDKESNKLTREVLLWDKHVKDWLFEGEKLSPLKKSYMAHAFGVSQEALDNTLSEYGIINSNNNHACPFYPNILECISKSARKKCFARNKPHKRCYNKTLETDFNIKLTL